MLREDSAEYCDESGRLLNDARAAELARVPVVYDVLFAVSADLVFNVDVIFFTVRGDDADDWAAFLLVSLIVFGDICKKLARVCPLVAAIPPVVIKNNENTTTEQNVHFNI